MVRLRSPDFWWQAKSATGYALAPLGLIYGAVSGSRMRRPGHSVRVPVICIGNLVLGGAGKTPTALAVAALAREIGAAPGFLTRGYGGRERGPVLVRRGVHTARDVGDEPILLASVAPTVVAVDRPAGARLLAELGIGLIIMDDGFQNPSLAKNMSILVIDAQRGIGNGLVFPAGPLRAPLLGQLRRADALVVLGAASSGTEVKGVRAAARAGLPIIRAELEPVRTRGFRKKTYLAFAGMGHPEKFFASLAQAGVDVATTLSFPDHHPYTDADCEDLLKRAEAGGLVPITTEKDRVRLLGREGPARRLAQLTEVFPVRLRFEEPRRMTGLIRSVLAEASWRKPEGAPQA